MAGKILGKAFIRVNGMSLASLPGTAKLSPGGVERKPVVGDHGFLGYTETPVHAEVECDIAIDASTDIIALNKTTDATVTFECDSGQVFIVRQGAVASPVGAESGTGKASVKMIGSPAEAA
jgi:hypothetical protein